MPPPPPPPGSATVKQYNEPNVDIDIPISDGEFCSAFISRKDVLGKCLLSSLEEVDAIGSQVASNSLEGL